MLVLEGTNRKKGFQMPPTTTTTTPKNSRSEQARINGSKSKGPVSIEGKAASSMNALKHGFAAAINVVIEVEDKPAWEVHLEGYRSSFEPQCYVEETLVDQLANISWRQSRLVGLETALIDAQISIQGKNVDDIHPRSADDPYFHLVQAWQALARQPEKQNEPKDPSMPPNGYDIGSIELVRRYQVSLDRQYRNALLNLRQYRKDFASAPPNEPKVTKNEAAPPPADVLKPAIVPPPPSFPAAKPPQNASKSFRPEAAVPQAEAKPSIENEHNPQPQAL
jgi:hypothetical protein